MLNKATNRMQQGFSLMVISLILIMLGASVILTMIPLKLTLLEKIQLTEYKLEKIRAAVNTYYAINGFNPCPADFTLPLSDAGFGLETNTNAATNCRSVNACSGGGLACPALPVGNKTWAGAVPVRSLGLADDYEFDAWGNRFTYAVNNNVHFPVNNINGNGGTVKYHILSHGPNGKGAYSRGGARKACPLDVGVSAGLSEYQNCNYTGDDTFLNRPWNSGIDFYDDIGLK